jgi:hypothetical protein
VAYSVTGTGPYLLEVPGWLSHLEFGWAVPADRVFHESLSSGRTLVRYDGQAAGSLIRMTARARWSAKSASPAGAAARAAAGPAAVRDEQGTINA